MYFVGGRGVGVAPTLQGLIVGMGSGQKLGLASQFGRQKRDIWVNKYSQSMSPRLFLFKFCWQIVREHFSQHHGVLSFFLGKLRH